MTDGLTITRTFAASRELVYAAWTRPEHFSVWFGTEAVDVPLDTLSMDVRVGGAWTAVMHLPDGNAIHWVDGGTEMTLTQTGGNLTEEQYAQTVIGYNGFFDAMDRLLAALAAGGGRGCGGSRSEGQNTP